MERSYILQAQDSEAQNVAYKRPKRRHVLNFQVITTPDGIIIKAYGTVGGLRYDWKLYMISGLDESLQNIWLGMERNMSYAVTQGTENESL